MYMKGENSEMLVLSSSFPPNNSLNRQLSFRVQDQQNQQNYQNQQNHQNQNCLREKKILIALQCRNFYMLFHF